MLTLLFFLLAHIAVKVHNPGPGSYRDQSALAKNGRYVKSTDKNCCVPSMKLPLRKKVMAERVVSDQPMKDIPWPGQYTPHENTVNNKYRNTYDYRLHARERKIEHHDKSKMDLPGPQQYILPSDFGNNHLASTQSFVIPQQSFRKKRNRNNALIQQNTTTSLMDAKTLNRGLTSAQKKSFTHLIASPNLVDPKDPSMSDKKQSINASRRQLLLNSNNIGNN